MPIRVGISDVIALGRDEIDAAVRDALCAHDAQSWDVAVFWHADRGAYSVKIRLNGVHLTPPSVPAFLPFEITDAIGLQRAMREYVQSFVAE